MDKWLGHFVAERGAEFKEVSRLSGLGRDLLYNALPAGIHSLLSINLSIYLPFANGKCYVHLAVTYAFLSTAIDPLEFAKSFQPAQQRSLAQRQNEAVGVRVSCGQ